jgi:ribosomal protein S18 acetylase RimI-like enzyme
MVAISDKSLIKFELVKDADLHSLHEVSTLAYYQAYFGAYTYNDLKPYLEDFFSEEILEEEIAKPDQDYFLVKKSDRAIGFAQVKRFVLIEESIRRQSDNSAELFKLYLLQKYTGKGIGTRFMQMMSEHYQSRGFQNFYSTVWSLSPRALRFYKRQGFEVVGEIDYDYAGKNNIDYVLKKNLILVSDRMPSGYK